MARNSASGPTTIVPGSNELRAQMFGDGRHGGQVVGLDARTDVAQASGAVEVSVDGDHPIEAVRDQTGR